MDGVGRTGRVSIYTPSMSLDAGLAGLFEVAFEFAIPTENAGHWSDGSVDARDSSRMTIATGTRETAA